MTAIRLYSPSLSLSMLHVYMGIYGRNAGVVTLSKHSRVVCGVMCCTVASAFTLFFSGPQMNESREKTQRTTLMSIVIESDFVMKLFLFFIFLFKSHLIGCVTRTLLL